MGESTSMTAKRIAEAARDFEDHLTGRAPKSVTVVLSEETLAITLHGVLQPAEKALARDAAGAVQVPDFHRQRSQTHASHCFKRSTKITGVEVGEAAAEIEPSTGTLVRLFTTGTVVEVFLFAPNVAASSWSESSRAGQLQAKPTVAPAPE
jgi:uncharacterized protein YbcI